MRHCARRAEKPHSAPRACPPRIAGPISEEDAVFTKQHYIEIARIISTFATQEMREHVARRFMVELDKKEKNFNSLEFLRACGVRLLSNE
jgi:hypothetical protein